MLIISQSEVRELLDLDALVEALQRAFVDAHEGRASMPPRVGAKAPPDNMLAAMVSYLPSSNVLAAKLVTLFPNNAQHGKPSHQAVIVVFDTSTGTPVAMMDGTYITATRTAATSALATRLLARRDADTLAVLGSGVQARTHARALVRVRPIREIRIASRSIKAAQALAAELGADLDLTVRACESYAEALDGAGIVAATTHPHEPVVQRQWISPGTHINSVGFSSSGREVDAETVRDSVLVVETREAALAPYPAGSTDLLWAIRDNIISPQHVHASLGELITKSRPGRTNDAQITLFKSVGIAIEDAAAAALTLAAARDRRGSPAVQ